MISISTRSGSKRAAHPASLSRVLVGILAVCLLLVGLDAWRTWQARRQQLAAATVATANLARSLAQHAHDMVEAADTAIVGLREAAEHDDDDSRLSRLDALAAAFVTSQPALHGIAIYDATGQRVVGSEPTRNAPEAGDRAYFLYHRLHDDRALRVGDPMRSQIDGRWVIPVSRRIDGRDGAFLGVAIATISIDFLQRFYATFNVGPHGAIALVGVDGIVLARQPAFEMRAPGAAPPSIARGQIISDLLPQAEVGNFEEASPIDGTLRLGSYRQVAGVPLVVIVSRGLGDILAKWRADASFHLVISLGAALIVGWLGIRFARQNAARQRAERRYRLLADYSGDAIVCVALDGERRYASPAFQAMTGWSYAEVRGTPWGHLVHIDDRAGVCDIPRQLLVGGGAITSTFRYLCKDGSLLWAEARIQLMPAEGGEPPQFVANIRDISRRKEAEAKLEEANRQLAAQARTDDLTGLANRRRFDEALDQECRRASRDEMPLSLLLLDVDHFKKYNDRYGHPSGDQCLREVAATLAACAQRPGDLAARYGGEEFAVLLPGTAAEGAASVAERLRGALEALGIPHHDNAPGRVVTASFGIATLPSPGVNEAASLIAAADGALYESKHQGRNRVTMLAGRPASGMPILPHERDRLDALQRYETAGAAKPTDSMDRLARLTAALFDVPVSTITLVGQDRQCFIGRVGVEAESTAREVSFCAFTIAGDAVFTVGDALSDPRFAENPLVTCERGIRFYAGAPLRSPIDGQNLGALCIIDHVPRQPLTSSEKALLQDLAALAVSHMDQRRLDADLRAQGMDTPLPLS